MSAEPDDLRVLHRLSLGPGDLHHDLLLPEVRRVGSSPVDGDHPVGDLPEAPLPLSARDEHDALMFRSALTRYEAKRARARSAAAVEDSRRARFAFSALGKPTR